jgi:hypothetical protein
MRDGVLAFPLFGRQPFKAQAKTTDTGEEFRYTNVILTHVPRKPESIFRCSGGTFIKRDPI